MNLSYEIYLSGEVDIIDLYTYREERDDYTPIVLSSLVPQLYNMGYIFDLDEHQLHISIDTIETVNMDVVEEELGKQAMHVVKDGVVYYILPRYSEETGTFDNVTNDDVDVVTRYFANHNIGVAVEQLPMDLEGEDGETVEVRGMRLTAIIIGDKCDILVKADMEEFIELLQSFGNLMQRNKVVEWDSDDFSNLINKPILKTLIGHVPNNKKFEDEVIPTLNSIIRKQIIDSLERMTDNRRAFLMPQDLPLYVMGEVDERTIINIAEFTNLVGVLTAVNGYKLSNPDLNYYKALNGFVIWTVKNGTQRALLNGRKYMSVHDL